MQVDTSYFRVATALSCTVLLCTLLLVTMPATAVDATSEPVKAVDDVAALHDAALVATDSFTPITEKEICQAKSNLQKAAASLDEQLQKVGPIGKGWEKYLDWGNLKPTIDSSKPDMELLKNGYTALAASHRGLELACFIDLHLTLERYMNLRLAADSPKIKAAYDKLVAELPQMLEDYATNPTSNPSAPLQQVVTWLDKFEQAPALLALLRADFAKPNFYASVSKRLIASGFEEEVSEPVNISDVILKTQVHSQGTMSGKTTLDLIPSETEAILNVKLAGTSETRNTGRRGPVLICSDSTTQIAATKKITIDAEGIQSAPTDAKVNTSTSIRSIQTKGNRKMIEKVAWKKVRKSKCQAEAIASRRAERRIRGQMNDQADPTVAKANEDFQKQFKLPLLHRKLFPNSLNFSTTQDSMKIIARQNGLAQFAAWSDPPKVNESETDASVRIHESVVNNSTWTFLAGRTFAEEEFLALITDLSGGELPEKFRPDEDQEPWAITFAKENPIRVTFHDGQIRIEIHATSFKKGTSEYTAMNIAATYKIEPKDGQFELIRMNDLEVFPPGFESENRKLSVREQTLRKLLQKRFSKIFESKWTSRNEVPLPKRWKSAGSLHLNGWSAEDGWMTMTWKLGE